MSQHWHLWGTGNEYTIVCTEYFDVVIPNKQSQCHLSNHSLFPIVELYRMHGISGITIEGPVVIRSRKTLLNGANDRKV